MNAMACRAPVTVPRSAVAGSVGRRAVSLASRPAVAAGAFLRNKHTVSLRRSFQVRAEGEGSSKEPVVVNVDTASASDDISKEIKKMASKTAGTFAPRSSGKSKNPATPGTLLYSIFEWQAMLSIVVGGLLAFNVIYPSEGPTIARMLGMWSVWMLAVPSLRARDCSKDEKDILNYLFILIPLTNVAIPFLVKDFGVVFGADVVELAGLYAWKGILPVTIGEPAAAAASSDDDE